MRRSTILITIILVFFLFGFQECVVYVPPGPTTPQSPVERAQVGGKYKDLQQVIDVPDDKNTYGDFYDLGYKKTRKYKGYSNLPYGYWVYVYPSWYIWKTKTEEQKPAYDYDKASINGKYENVLKTLYIPDDKDRFGNLYDWGYRNVSTYSGNKNLPKGYWVYAYPYWYIWEREAKTYSSSDEEKAKVGGKYYNLLKVIRVDSDRNSFGTFYDWGYRTNSSYSGYTGLPKGYWVYVYPNWFIWKNKKETETDEDKASVNSKYDVLLRTLYVPADESRIGSFYDYGYSSQTSYAGYSGIPAGYWVYVAPQWYIWRDMKGYTPGPSPGDQSDPKSAYGKYYNLKKEVFSPFDMFVYGQYYDKGYSNEREYAGEKNLPAGYWVYYSPNWYIWGNAR